MHLHTHTLLASEKAMTPILQKSVKNKEEGVTWNVSLEENIKYVFGLLMRLVKEASPKGFLERQDWETLSADLCPLYPLTSVLDPCFY